MVLIEVNRGKRAFRAHKVYLFIQTSNKMARTKMIVRSSEDYRQLARLAATEPNPEKNPPTAAEMMVRLWVVGFCMRIQGHACFDCREWTPSRVRPEIKHL